MVFDVLEYVERNDSVERALEKGRVSADHRLERALPHRDVGVTGEAILEDRTQVGGRFDEHELRTQVLNAARHGSGAGPDLERAPVDLPADVVEQPLVVFDEVFARLEGLCVVGLNLTA